MKSALAKALLCQLLAAIALTSAGCDSSNQVPGLDGFQAAVVESRLVVSFTATTLHWNTGATVQIPGLDDAFVGANPNATGPGVVFQFTVALASLLDGLNGGQAPPLAGLPDGRLLPDIEGGKLPRWDASVGALKLSLYLSDDAFAFFLPLSFSAGGVTLPQQISVNITDERGNLIGRAYAIPALAASDESGLLVLLPYLGGPAGG